jgi:maltokinase
MSELATRLAGDAGQFLPEAELLEFVRGQRWFGAKTSEIASVRVLDSGVLRSEPPLLVDTLVEIRYAAGTHDLYQLIVGVAEGEDASGPRIASGDGWTTYEAFADPSFVRELIGRVYSGTSVPTEGGDIEFDSLGAIEFDETGAMREPGDLGEIRELGLEQSNSSVVIGEELIVKAYRRLEAGLSPELELLRFLTAHGFQNVPPIVGWWSYCGSLMISTLGIAQRFVGGATDGWTLATDDPEAFSGRVRRLGEVIGTMHCVLAGEPDDPAFCPEDASAESLGLLMATIDDEIDQIFLHLPDDEAVAPLQGRGEDVRSLLRDLATVASPGRSIRHHGDLHLGQVLWAEDDWLVIDFEGEPARSLTERRRKRSPLRDVAGMLRSFAYAATYAGHDPTGAFERQAREDFLATYYQAVSPAAILPPPETSERLIRIFELEKAIYELRYELTHRPDWVRVPVSGIMRLLEEGH